jgi:hypothetical protein
MKHRQQTVAEKDWDGEFGTYDEWARLGPHPPYRSATFTDAQGRRCVTQQDFAQARDDRAFAGEVSLGGGLSHETPAMNRVFEL